MRRKGNADLKENSAVSPVAVRRGAAGDPRRRGGPHGRHPTDNSRERVGSGRQGEGGGGHSSSLLAYYRIDTSGSGWLREGREASYGWVGAHLPVGTRPAWYGRMGMPHQPTNQPTNPCSAQLSSAGAGRRKQLLHAACLVHILSFSHLLLGFSLRLSSFNCFTLPR